MPTHEDIRDERLRAAEGIARERIDSDSYDLLKLVHGLTGIATLVSGTDPLPVTVKGTVSTDITGGGGGAATNAKYATLSHNTATLTEIVAAVVGKKIRVLALSVTIVGTVEQAYELRSGATTVILNADTIGGTSGDPLVLVPSELGYCETASGEALSVKIPSTVVTKTSLTYVEI